MGVVRQLAWSHSRGNAWRSCPRAYFFEYCSNEEVGLESAPLLRGLKSLPMLAGIVVDGAITEALRSIARRDVVSADLASKAVRTLVSHIETSPWRAERLRRGIRPADGEYVLYGDYYISPAAPAEVEKACVQVVKALGMFLDSELFGRLTKCQGRGFIFPPNRAPSFRQGEVGVYAAFDFALQHGGRIVVFDWKSGRRSDLSEQTARRQLGIYAIYFKQRFRLDSNQVLHQAAWLHESPTWQPEPLTTTLEAMVENDISAGTGEIEQRLRRGQDSSGRPCWIARIEDFDARPEARRCGSCRFRELCDDGRIAVPFRTTRGDDARLPRSLDGEYSGTAGQ